MYCVIQLATLQRISVQCVNLEIEVLGAHNSTANITEYIPVANTLSLL